MQENRAVNNQLSNINQEVLKGYLTQVLFALGRIDPISDWLSSFFDLFPMPTGSHVDSYHLILHSEFTDSSPYQDGCLS